MADLAVIIPTRERPGAAADVIAAFGETCAADTYIIFAVDEDDPERGEYLRAIDGKRARVLTPPSRTMVQALNAAAEWCAALDDAPFAIGFMGDDHRPRTVGWDKEYLDALHELGTGVVYGNDLLQGEALPTQCAMTADIIRALGYMAPPSLRHMYVDNFWLDLGRQADCLYYLPDVVVEHMHPLHPDKKADWDEGYRRVNAGEIYDADAMAYAAYGRDQFAADLAKVKALRGAA